MAPTNPSTSHISLPLPQPWYLFPAVETPQVISTHQVFTVASSRMFFSDYFPVSYSPVQVTTHISPQRRPFWSPHLEDHPPSQRSNALQHYFFLSAYHDLQLPCLFTWNFEICFFVSIYYSAHSTRQGLCLCSPPCLGHFRSNLNDKMNGQMNEHKVNYILYSDTMVEFII